MLAVAGVSPDCLGGPCPSAERSTRRRARASTRSRMTPVRAERILCSCTAWCARARAWANMMSTSKIARAS